MTIEMNSEEHKRASYVGLIVPFAKYLHNENIAATELDKDSVLDRFLKEVEKGDIYKVEIHLDSIETHLESIETLTNNKNYLSATILTAVTLEESINWFMRVACTAKGYEHKPITRYIQETALKTKIELVLPILGVIVYEPLKTAVYELLPLRNSAIHGKAVPSLHSEEDTLASVEENQEKAQKLIARYPISKIKEYIRKTEESISNIPEFKLAHEILSYRLYKKRP